MNVQQAKSIKLFYCNYFFFIIMLTVIWPTELYVKSTIEKIDQCKKYMYIYHCIAYTTDSVNLYQSQKKKKIKIILFMK